MCFVAIFTKINPPLDSADKLQTTEKAENGQGVLTIFYCLHRIFKIFTIPGERLDEITLKQSEIHFRVRYYEI